MTTESLLADWSVALAVWLIGAAVLGFWRLSQSGTALGPRRSLVVGGITGLCLFLGWRHISAVWFWAHGITPTGVYAPEILAQNAGITVCIHIIAGALTWEACRHRGWASLLAVGAAAGLAWDVVT